MVVNLARSHQMVRPLAAAVAIGGVLAGAGTVSAAEPGTCPGGDALPSGANRPQVEAATTCLVNAERLARGLVPLRPDPRLDQAARAHNDDMQARGYFSHTSPVGSTLAERLRAVGYTDVAGENLLKGTVAPVHAVNLWLASPAHRAVLLDPAYRGIGIAQEGVYWTQTAGRAEPGGDGNPSGNLSTPAPQGGGASAGSGQASATGPKETAGLGDGSDPGGNEGSAEGSGSSSDPAGRLPARLRIVRAGVRRGRLDASADISELTNGDAVRVSFTANGRRYAFTERIAQGRLRIGKRLPKGQRAAGTGIMKIRYPGDERVQPAEVRLRAARRSARLEPQLLSLRAGVLHARGTISRRARGVVRLRLSTEGGDRWYARARIANGRWQLQSTLPDELHKGGYLTIQYTGYRPARISGAQIAMDVLGG